MGWIDGICVVIAVVGTLASLYVRKVPPANPTLKLEASSFAVPPDMLRLLRDDRPLLLAVWVSSVFWMLAGMVPSAINSLGKIVFEAGDKFTSYLAGVVSIGIAVGCVIGGLVSKGKVDFRLLRIGAFGMMASLGILAVSADGDLSKLPKSDGVLEMLPGIGESTQWLGYWGSIGMLFLLGAFTGLFAVPLQVFMQTRPPDDKKGRMIAVMNQANWIGIFISGFLYDLFSALIESQEWPRSTMFLFIGSLLIPVALFYHPKNQLLEHERKPVS